ncbi:MAG: rhomboid family intramembrane serine protease [Bacteroidota bacterium]|nr:rhomboid family intramembrane serine protease [Bacteroidota bacterium]
MFNFSITPAVRNLLLINLVVFITDKFVFDLTNLFGLRYIYGSEFYPFQFFTYMFLHADFSHIFFNMFALFMFGPLLERFWGPKKFLIFYIITGIGGGVIYSIITFYNMYDLQSAINLYLQDPNPDKFTIFMDKYAKGIYHANYNFINRFAENPTDQGMIQESIDFVKVLFDRKANAPLIGASGCVFGVLMAFGMLFPNTELFIFPLPVPIKAWLYVTFYGLIELYAGVRAQEGDNVAHFAHIGGMVFAYIMIRLWKSRRDEFY